MTPEQYKQQTEAALQVIEEAQDTLWRKRKELVRLRTIGLLKGLETTKYETLHFHEDKQGKRSVILVSNAMVVAEFETTESRADLMRGHYLQREFPDMAEQFEYRYNLDTDHHHQGLRLPDIAGERLCGLLLENLE